LPFCALESRKQDETQLQKPKEFDSQPAAGGTGTITHSGNSTLNILGRSATPVTINANINSPINTYLNAGDQATGAITIGSGKNWEVFVTRLAFNLNNNGGSPAPKSGNLTIDGGYLKSQALYILQSSGNSTGANNSAVLNLNNGGTIETFDIARATAPGSSLTFNWNDGTIRGYGNGAGTALRSEDANNPLVVSIAGTGNHTFHVLGNEATTVQSTAILANKIGENGTITKTGAGSMTINSTSTYTGSTTISAGTLLLGSGGSIATSSTINVATGATFNVSAVSGGYVLGTGQTLKGGGTVLGNATINGNLQPGNSPGLLTVNGTLTLASNSTTTIEIDGSTTRGTDFDAIDVSSDLTYGGNLTLAVGTTFGTGNYTFNVFDSASQTSTFNAITLSGNYTGSLTGPGNVWSLTSGLNTWTFTHSTGDLGLTVVPEPATWALLAGSLTTLLVFRRRRRESSRLR
jgi:fibronectin-binding autotransporter adhesin